MVNLVKNNREVILLGFVIVGMFAAAIAVGVQFRGGQPWAYTAQYQHAVSMAKDSVAMILGGR